jgi:H+-translocating NAD(P) transhydrogenase
MCEAMGRNILNVILGGAGTVDAPKGEAVVIEGEITTASVDSVKDALLEARNIIITPGYGLAVAQAQFAIADIAKDLKAMGKNVRFGYVHFVGFYFAFELESNIPSPFK